MSDVPGGGSRGDRPTTDAVVLRQVYKHFDQGLIRALHGAELTVRGGEWVAVTGPSGCGKSTLMHLLAGLDQPTSGSVVVFGQDLGTMRDPARYRRTEVGLVFQLHNLLPQLTAAQNIEIAMFGRRGRAARRRRALQLLADVDLAGREDRPPTRLSGGERQRVAIARALANEPRLLLADEPTGNLDSGSVERVVELIQRLRANRPELTVIMVTHDHRVAAAADRIVQMSDGQIISPGTRARPAAELTDTPLPGAGPARADLTRAERS
ncbi:MAG TPA: ABC transporter ATP-binding protein [Jatrophihabitans sp.]|nr:ABC transporter ATP-binding protein [Jatrophihabitans sp.]